MSTFGAYARRILAQHERGERSKPVLRPKVLAEYDRHKRELHRAEQPCPGSCRADACVNTVCGSHPATYYFLTDLVRS